MINGETASFTGLVLQTVGIVLLALLCAFLRRSIERDFMRYWSHGWAVLAASLTALSASLELTLVSPALRSLYHFGGFVFGYLLLVGCRNYADRHRPQASDLWFALPAAALALGLGHAPLLQAAIVQSIVMFFVLALAFVHLWRLHDGPQAGSAVHILLVALALLALGRAVAVPVLGVSVLAARPLPALYTAYAPLCDLLLEVLLGFGMVTLLMEDTHRHLRDANRELRQAKERVETAARTDPLTDSLNRHALHAVIETHRERAGVGGSVAVVDIDDLKRINDDYGHTAGDIAIRAVARAIRALVRADDLVFRWGGDEFLLLLFGLDAEEARSRLAGINAALTGLRLPGVPDGVDISVSVGVAPILPAVGLDRTIEQADDAMYRRKHARRAAAMA